MPVKRKKEYFKFLEKSKKGLLFLIGLQAFINTFHFGVEYFLNIITKFSLILTNPLQALTFAFLVPVVYALILFAKLVVGIVRILLPLNTLTWIKDKYFSGFSVINWPNIELLSDEHDKIVLKAIDLLKNEEDLHSFNPTIAKMSTIISTLVYERLSYVKERSRRSYNLDYTRMHHYELAYPLQNSIPIQFESIHILYSVARNIIIVAFKGTDSFNLKDNHIDAISKKITATQWLFGEVHSGFYKTLFSKYREPTSVSSDISLTTVADRDPFAFLGTSAFTSTVNSIKRIVFLKFKKQIPVLFVTGHGCGAALATLFHCRLIRVPQTLPVKFVGSYVLGCPHVGSFDFCASWLSGENVTRINKKRCPSLWRIVAGNDLIAKLPLSAHQGSNPFGGYLLDFGDVGKGVHLHHDKTLRYVISIADVNYADLYLDSWRYLFIDLVYPLASLLGEIKGHAFSLSIKQVFLSSLKIGLLPFRDHFTSTYFKLLSDCKLDENVQVEYS